MKFILNKGRVFVEECSEKFCSKYIDLTQLLGASIANYIYELEMNHSSKGVEYFKKLFPKLSYIFKGENNNENIC